MGMYDTVHVKCPKCETRLEVQSKAGECTLGNYEGGSVPPVVADDIAGERHTCSACYTEVILRTSLPKRISVVADVYDASADNKYWD